MNINEHILKLSGTAYLDSELPRGKTLIFAGESISVPVSGGKGRALVDPSDFPLVSKYKWNLVGAGYAAALINGKRAKMHHLFLKPPAGFQVDHINCNKLDNRRCNLRLATRGQNNMNRPSYQGTSSQYKGVSWNKEKQRWEAFITKDYKFYRLGYFDEERHAAMVRDIWARELHGEFSRLNFPNALWN